MYSYYEILLGYLETFISFIQMSPNKALSSGVDPEGYFFLSLLLLLLFGCFQNGLTWGIKIVHEAPQNLYNPPV